MPSAISTAALICSTNCSLGFMPTSPPPTKRLLYVFLGDYIDRGSSSRQTIDRLIEHGAANESVFLKAIMNLSGQ